MMNLLGVTKTGWCPNCGETHLTLLGKCTRCGAGGVAAATQETVDHIKDLPVERNGTGNVAELPANAATRRWLQQTQALLDSLKAERREAERKAREADARVAALDSAIGTLHDVLRLVRVPGAETGPSQRPAALPAPRQRGRRTGRWSQNYDACIDCGRTDRKHAAKGRCQACDWTHRKKAKS